MSATIALELHVPDFQPAAEFYGVLGFTTYRTESENGGYMVLRRGETIINFYSGSDEVYNHSYFKQFDRETPRGYGVEIIITSNDLDIDHAALHEKDYEIVDEIKERPWGARDFRVTDPYGYYIRITQPIDY